MRGTFLLEGVAFLEGASVKSPSQRRMLPVEQTRDHALIYDNVHNSHCIPGALPRYISNIREVKAPGLILQAESL